MPTRSPCAPTPRAPAARRRGRTNRVTPNPIPGPRDVLHGTPQSVTYDQYSLMIGGRRTFIYSGEFDPWRLPSPSLWLDRLQKMKADGYNAVTPYFDWDYHSRVARRLRLLRHPRHQRVPQHGPGGGAVRHRPARPVHQRRDRRRGLSRLAGHAVGHCAGPMRPTTWPPPSSGCRRSTRSSPRTRSPAAATSSSIRSRMSCSTPSRPPRTTWPTWRPRRTLTGSTCR